MDAEAYGGSLTPLTRLSLAYLLDSIALSRLDGDVVDRLILAAIFDANVAPIKRDSALQAAYAAVDAPPPETVRRPVSMNAVAQSLRLPFETVRRRIRRLTSAGVCQTTPRGVLLRPEIVAGPTFLAMAEARYQRLRRFHDDLAAAGLLPALPEVEAIAAGIEHPVRIANRLLAEFMMRSVEGVIQPLHDPLAALILLHVLRAHCEGAGPVSAATLAGPTRIPTETVRRRLLTLERDGYCRRSRRGAALAPGALERPAVAAFVEGSASSVQRLFAGAARLGVLAAWRREDEEKASRLAG